MSLIEQATKSLFLSELLKGMTITFRQMFSPKVTVNYPYERGPISARFRGEHALRRYPNGEERCIASCARRSVRLRRSPSRLSRAATAAGARRATTSTWSNVFTAASARKPARWMPSSKDPISSLPPRRGKNCSTTNKSFWTMVSAGKARSQRTLSPRRRTVKENRPQEPKDRINS